MTSTHLFYSILQIFTIATIQSNGAQIPTVIKPLNSKPSIEPTVKIQCLSGSMVITIKNAPPGHDGLFSGKIYPKGLSKNSTCLSEYRYHDGVLKYKLPLRSCNTMPVETDDGGMEFFNTIILQPHLKLVTDLGRGYHVRCRYRSRDEATKKKIGKVTGSISIDGKSLENPQPLRSDEEGTNDDDGIGTDRRDHGRSLDKRVDDENESNNEISSPGCHMKIYNEQNKIAENVHIGDMIKLVVNIDAQEKFGLLVTDCLVRDGLNWGEQKLVNEEGCPTDSEIMGPFDYSENRMSAKVSFPAHKFPYSAAVYYQCNIRLCELDDPDCQKEPLCDGTKRLKRQTDGKDDGVPATIEVFSGLYVNENADVTEGSDGDLVFKEKTPDDALCVSQRTFAIAIAVAGLILMLAVVAAVLCIMARRRSKTVSNSGSSIYSGPYTNTAFSHSS